MELLSRDRTLCGGAAQRVRNRRLSKPNTVVIRRAGYGAFRSARSSSGSPLLEVDPPRRWRAGTAGDDPKPTFLASVHLAARRDDAVSTLAAPANIAIKVAEIRFPACGVGPGRPPRRRICAATFSVGLSPSNSPASATRRSRSVALDGRAARNDPSIARGGPGADQVWRAARLYLRFQSNQAGAASIHVGVWYGPGAASSSFNDHTGPL
jgi:hypothetical protein